MFGLNFKGNHGVTQIDQNYANFVVVRKETIAINQMGSYYSMNGAGGTRLAYQVYFREVDTGLPVDSYTIAHSSDTPALMQWRRFDSNTGTLIIRFMSRGGPINLTYYVYGPPSRAPAPSGNWGVRIFESGTNNVRYDSRLNYLKILGEYEYLFAADQDMREGPLYSGRSIAFMPARQVIQTVRFPGGGGQGSTGNVFVTQSSCAIRSNGTTSVGPIVFDSQPSGPSTPNGQPEYSNYPDRAFYYIVDVAGF